MSSGVGLLLNFALFLDRRKLFSSVNNKTTSARLLLFDFRKKRKKGSLVGLNASPLSQLVPNFGYTVQI